MVTPEPFYERYWKEKSSDELFDFSYKWPAIQTIIPNKKNTTLLDYGCGTGFLLKHIQEKSPKLTLIGADISSEGLKRAKKNIPEARFIQLKENEPISLKDNSIDFITCLDVIEHVYDVEPFIENLHRVLRPKGKMVISTPYHGLIKNLVVSTIAFDTVFDPVGPHIRFFTTKSLTKCLTKAGFKIQKIGYYGRFYPLWRGFYIVVSK